jgi:hypothetical protein
MSMYKLVLKVEARRGEHQINNKKSSRKRVLIEGRQETQESKVGGMPSQCFCPKDKEAEEPCTAIEYP